MTPSDLEAPAAPVFGPYRFKACVSHAHVSVYEAKRSQTSLSIWPSYVYLFSGIAVEASAQPSKLFTTCESLLTDLALFLVQQCVNYSLPGPIPPELRGLECLEVLNVRLNSLRGECAGAARSAR